MAVNRNYTVKTKNSEFSFSEEELDTAQIIRISENSYHILSDGKSLSAEILADDEKNMKLKIGHSVYDLEIQEPLDVLLQSMGFNKAQNLEVKEMTAPMPGLVKEIFVQPGDSVKKGDKLLILEAMKMENSIVSPVDGTIKSVPVVAGNSANKKEVLIIFE